MRTKIATLIVAAALAACGGEEGMVYDESVENVSMEGRFYDRDVDLHLRGDPTLVAYRQYRGPIAPGTDPADAIPDLTMTRLCDVGLDFEAEVDGQTWSFEFDLESVDADTFGVGTVRVYSPNEPLGPGRSALELEMASGAAALEQNAISGTVEVRHYSGTPAADYDYITEGGELGATFEIFFGPGNELRGTFFLEFGDNDIVGEDC